MFNCPVCENRYLQEIPEFCQVCDWQLTSDSSSLDKIRLEWAKKVWHRLNDNSSLENISDRLQQLEIQFKQATQERTNLQNQLEWVHALSYQIQILRILCQYTSLPTTLVSSL